jgi:hypothetical protein
MHGKTERIELRASEGFLKSLDEWRRRQPDLPSRSSAIRQLVEEALASESGKPAGKRKWTHIGRTAMNANVWLIVVVVLVVLSVILSVMDRSFLSPMYLLVLALVVMVGTSVKFPW